MQPDIANEEKIIWLHPPERYAYLREKAGTFDSPVAFPKRERPDGARSGYGPLAHLVAYAVLKRKRRRYAGEMFYRRFWFVKGYDNWEGHGDNKGFFYDARHCPSEAVIPETIQAGKASVPGTRNDQDWVIEKLIEQEDAAVKAAGGNLQILAGLGFVGSKVKADDWRKQERIRRNIAQSDVLSEGPLKSYQVLRLTRVRYYSESDPFIDLRVFSRGWDEEDREKFYPTRQGIHMPERDFVRLLSPLIDAAPSTP